MFCFKSRYCVRTDTRIFSFKSTHSEQSVLQMNLLFWMQEKCTNNQSWSFTKTKKFKVWTHFPIELHWSLLPSYYYKADAEYAYIPNSWRFFLSVLSSFFVDAGTMVLVCVAFIGLILFWISHHCNVIDVSNTNNNATKQPLHFRLLSLSFTCVTIKTMNS